MPLVDLLAPPALDFRRHVLTMGDGEAQALVVVDYPPRVGQAWLARLAALPGVSLSLHLAPTDPLSLLKALNSSIQEYMSRLSNGGNALVQSRWQQSLDDARALLKQIDQESQKVYRAAVLLLVVAPDQEELARRVRQVEAACAAASMRARPAVFKQEEGVKAAGPWGLLPREIADLGAREMPAATVAAAYPWVSSGLNHGRGIVLGRDDAGGIVLVDGWTPSVDSGLTNGNINVLGKPGSGKTFSAQIHILRQYALGTRILALDPLGDYGRLARSQGGCVIDASGKDGRVNPLHVSALPSAGASTPEVGTRGVLAQHVQRLKTFFGLYLPSALDALEQAVLEKAIVAAYRDRGIDWSTDPATVGDWPTIADVRRQVQAMGQDRLAILLESATDGADSALWQGQSTIAIGQADFVVFDLELLKDAAPNVRKAQYFNILAWAWDMVREGKALGKHTLLVVDEAWMLIDPQTPQALQFVFEIAKGIRHYGPSPIGSALMVVTQNVGDFLSPEVARLGQPIIANASTKLLMQQDPVDIDHLRGALRLSEAECDLLAGAKRGEGLLLAGSQHVRVRIEAAAHEAEIIAGAAPDA